MTTENMADSPSDTEFTAEELQYLSTILTDPTGDLYVFRPEADIIVVGAAMARLSRSDLDLRRLILKEFRIREDANKLHHRVISEFGDDSVQQLIHLQAVRENASNLLTKQIEWGRLMGYLERSTRYVVYGRKNGRWPYFVPGELSEELKAEYIRTMDLNFERYLNLFHSMRDYFRAIKPQRADQSQSQWLTLTKCDACDAVRHLLPASVTSTVGFVGSAQAFDNMIMRLRAEELEEFRDTGEMLLQEVRKVAPAFFERTDIPDRGNMISAHRYNTRQAIRTIAKELLPTFEREKSPSNANVDVRLVGYYPESELSVLPWVLLPEAEHSVEEISKVLRFVSEEKQKEILKAYFGERLNRRHKPGRALEHPHYEFEIKGDYGAFRDLQRHRPLDDMTWQRLTAVHGYKIPDSVVEAGFAQVYKDCFAASEELYWKMRDRGFEPQAQYATLLGHHMRYTFTLNAREAFHLIELRSQPQGHESYRRIAQKMHSLIAEVHPTIAGGMKYADHSSPEFGREASEKAAEERRKKKLE